MKVSDSYASLVQGVSQQSSELRGPGRMGEQINMIPDPVYGLTRRHGTLFTAGNNTGISTNFAQAAEDSASFRTLSYSNGTDDIDLMIRSKAKVSGSALNPVIAYNRSTGVFCNYVRNAVDATLDLLESGGSSAAVAVGKYVFAAGNTIVPAASSVDQWSSSTNAKRSVVWVRGGAYSRKFKVTATHTTLGNVTVTYETPSSAYSGALDTSRIPQYTLDPAGGVDTEAELCYVQKITGTPPWGGGATHYWRADLSWGQWAPAVTTGSISTRSGTTVTTAAMANTYPANPSLVTNYYWNTGDRYVYFSGAWDTYEAADPTLQNIWTTINYTHNKVVVNPNYTRIVTDITSAYNTAVTQWISSSTLAVAPASIATSLKDLLVVAGITGATVIDSHIILDDVTALEVSDSGDGSLIRGVSNTVHSIEELTDIHWPGKVVRVQASDSAESFYITADGVGSTPASVKWVEGTASVRTITSGLVYILVSGNTVYAASTAALLNTISAGSHPDWVPSAAGDSTSSPLPAFIGQKIGYLGVFQDRLLIGSKGTLTLSRASDYLNFFRTTVITVPASDSYGMRSEGPDDDELRFSATYNKDLVVFGRKRQYIVGGRVPLSPSSANMPIMSTHADSSDVKPLDQGGLMFYASSSSGRSHVHQIEPTYNIDSPSSYPCSSQLDSYIAGDAIEFMGSTTPLALYLRTTGSPNSVYVFQYADSQQGRRQDAWYRWDFNEALGTVVGMSNKNNTMLVFFLREDNGTLWYVADAADMASGLSTRPYLDSMRLYSAVGVPGGTLSTVPSSPWAVAFDNTSAYFLQGRANATDAGALMTTFPAAPSGSRWVGCQYEGSAVLTNPVMKDRKDVPVTTGVLTIGHLDMTVKDSSGLTYIVTTKNGETVYTKNGRDLGDTQVGRVPVTKGLYKLDVYEETTSYTLRVAANSWLPLTISSIDWVGQFFNRTARLG